MWFHRFKYKNIIDQLKQHPKSHLTSFLILHEITAIVPIPIFYKILERYPIDYPITPELMEQGNKRMKRMVEIVGWEVDARQFLDLVTSYLIVKALLPVRVAASLGLTPLGARLIQRMFKSVS
jgi:hypothetical protein